MNVRKNVDTNLRVKTHNIATREFSYKTMKLVIILLSIYLEIKILPISNVNTY